MTLVLVALLLVVALILWLYTPASGDGIGWGVNSELTDPDRYERREAEERERYTAAVVLDEDLQQLVDGEQPPTDDGLPTA